MYKHKVRPILKEELMQFKPKKKFGQNFLHNQAIINAIIQAIHPRLDDNIVEIGPGLEALTIALLNYIDKISVIEIDKDIQNYLSKDFPCADRLNLIKKDVLKVEFAAFGSKLRIVGNLPYNISTPLLIKLISYKAQIYDMHFMLQKEVADRILAAPNCKQYGRLSIMLQRYFTIQHIIDVPSHAFEPQPKVASAFMRLIPHDNIPLNFENFKNFEKLIATAFAMRRKTIANNLKTLLSADDIMSLGVDPKQRPEQISIKKYTQIEKFIFK